ncbi:hypothetical protein K488DRAFT_75084 [Vararia minispora EC-137]|uniref:Uncharacterized protein n=1 Tax=Vararia minispora EC-137 TaxID=1314806 RepID=A0ACB8Q4V7_9AGAM|nr:hypothetical protein K488DRAFT_75084 [Vararia minispora EC-137]
MCRPTAEDIHAARYRLDKGPLEGTILREIEYKKDGRSRDGFDNHVGRGSCEGRRNQLDDPQRRGLPARAAKGKRERAMSDKSSLYKRSRHPSARATETVSRGTAEIRPEVDQRGGSVADDKYGREELPGEQLEGKATGGCEVD